MTEQTALTLPQRAALALESSKTEARLLELVASTSDMTEVLNKAARDQFHSAAMTYRDHRVTIEKVAKNSRDDATKFSKAVIAEENRLIEIITPEEKRLLALRDAYDEKIEAEKQAKLAVERARVAAIQAKIDSFGKLVLQAAGKSSQDISILRAHLTRSAPADLESEFEEFIDRAFSAYDEAGLALEVAYNAAYDAEQVAEASRIQREEEDRQRAEEAAKLEAQRQEQARIAAEQAAAQKRLDEAAAAQHAEIEHQQREAQAAINAAAAEQAAIQKAIFDANAAEMKRQADDLAAQRAAFEAEQAVIKVAADAEAEKQRKAEADAKAEKEHQEAEAKRIKDEQAVRERDRAHNAKIESEAFAYLVDAGLSEDGATMVINEIVAGKVPHVSITY